jgi:deazaflavin-dependent oxidoreductase (nitroreductase family)
MKVDPFTHQMIRFVSAMHVATYRLFGGMGFLNRNTLILTTRGRKSGRAIDKPLLYYQEDGKAYLVASYGGNDTSPAWYLNLTANPEVEAQIGSARRKYRARTLSAEEKRAVWPKLLAIYPSYADYQKKTSREIPLVELAPI